MPAPFFENLDSIRGKDSGATADIISVPLLLSGSDALNTSVYAVVVQNVTGTFTVDEQLYVNDVLTSNTVNQAVTAGCTGPSTSSL